MKALARFALVLATLRPAPLPGQVPAAERQALVDLYVSTNGPGWTSSTGWNGPAGTECSWFGVYCDTEGHVASISLTTNNLTGPLPHSLGNLTFLQSLFLYVNQLTGPIPPLTGLTRLVTLHLNGNQLTGPVPSRAGLPSLQYLLLGSNQLTGPVPPLQGLRYVYLADNQLSGGVPPLQDLPTLEYLDLTENLLTGQIPPFSGMTSLVDLRLGQNQLSGQIPPLSGLSSLEHIDLAVNQLTGAVPALVGLPQLRQIGLCCNQLSGPIPPFSGVGNLAVLRLSFNQLSGPIPSLAGVPHLQVLDLSHNQLTGPIPSLSGLDLRFLQLTNNRLLGGFPSLVGLINLSGLYLAGNQISGPIDASITSTSLCPVNCLDLRWNALYSEDPAVTAYVDSKDSFGWRYTQTIAPTGVSATFAAADSVTLSFTPILYFYDSGFYQAFYSTSLSGPFLAGPQTADKLASTLTISGLSMNTPYFFFVRTTTSPHADNSGAVTSSGSATVLAVTTPVTLVRFEAD